MEAHPEGQKSLALYGFFRRPRTEEDGPLLSVKQIRFTRGASRDAGDGDGAQGGGYESQCPTS